MKNTILTLLLLAGAVTTMSAQQKLMTKNGQASFYSKAPLEDIEAHNQNVVAILDLNAGEIAVKMLIKQFDFENTLMQEHFNENYMESDEYPSAVFSGTIKSDKSILLNVNAEYQVQVEGNITIHGVKKPLSTAANLMVKDGKVQAQTEFKVKTADFKIEIPSLVVKNIAEVIDIKLSFELNPINS